MDYQASENLQYVLRYEVALSFLKPIKYEAALIHTDNVSTPDVCGIRTEKQCKHILELKYMIFTLRALIL